MARISACMVLYHSGDTALEAVKCLAQANEEIDVYIVDNAPGSDDMAAERIRWMYPGVKYRPMEQNVGFGRGNNAVLDELKSEYHLLINPDVTFEPDVFTQMIAYMDANPTVAVLTPKVLNMDGTEQHLPKKQPTVHYLLSGFLERFPGPFKRWRREFTMADQLIHKPTRVFFATGCFLLIRTEVFRRLKGFDERFFLYQEDSDLSRRAQDYGFIYYHPDLAIRHAWARENTRSLKGIFRQVVSIGRFFAKWGIKW